MKIIEKQVLADVSGARLVKLKVFSPDIAAKARPGQFVVIMASENGERVPLTVVDKDLTNGAITLIFQEAGLTTRLLGKTSPGDYLYALAGPLGHPTEIKNYAKVILVGGGVGIAEIFPVAKALKEEKNHVTTILGARTKDLLILEKELKAQSDEFYVTTDDGSYERKGFVTDVLKELLEQWATQRSRSPDAQSGSLGNWETGKIVYAVGPIPMMRNVADVTRPFGIRTLVSLNALMVDATGMCGVCRVTVGNEMKFTCVDGPEFDGHLVDWDELIKRNRIYEEKEKHICKLILGT
jgi:ferredoxin--NADP+ reductase